MNTKKWELVHASPLKSYDTHNIVNILLENRNLKTKEEKEEFFTPIKPFEIALKETGIKKSEVEKAVKRVKLAIKKQEQIVVFGDYDADGVSATAILWECLDVSGANAIPFIPDRFTDGYGLNIKSVKVLKEKNPQISLVITVDNGIVANEAVEEIKKMGIDVIITDHHEASKSLPKALAIIHTTKMSGSGVAWFFVKEVEKSLPKEKSKFCFESNLELVALGTIADQIPLMGINRSLVKYGLEAFRKTTRPGILSLIEQAALNPEKIGIYEIGFLIAPRINSAGRLANAIESLRLVCTRDVARARLLAENISKSNLERQKILDEVVIHAKSTLGETTDKSIIIMSHESYHEGVIGLAASRLVEVFYRPSIVISKGEKESKASARSINGFNIIEAIRKHEHLILQGGGHTMAAGFSISNDKIDEFIHAMETFTKENILPELFQKKLRIDMSLPFSAISDELVKELDKFEPTGLGNPTGVFSNTNLEVVEVRKIGSKKNHLRLVVRDKDTTMEAVAFGMGELESEIKDKKVDVVFNVEENIWNGNRSLQLKVKDIKISDEKNGTK